ncbi:hypothetical protein ACFLZL_00385 [Thermodesulfobacteriota bacterium]
MGESEFFHQVKIEDKIPYLIKEADLQGYKLPALFGGLELEAEEEIKQKKAKSLGVDTIHVAKVFGGPYLLQFISEMITNWLPNPKGWVQGGKLSAKFIRPVRFNEKITCKGKVKNKIKKGGKKYIVCDVWIENAEGNKVTVGESTVAF